MEVGQRGRSLFRLSQLIFYFDVTTLVENHMVGGQITRFYLVGFKFATGIDDGEQQIPHLILCKFLKLPLPCDDLLLDVDRVYLVIDLYWMCEYL